MTDSKENLSKTEYTPESAKENKAETLQKPKRGQTRAKPQAKDKKKLKYNF
ncbi:MAG TPA: hypothetical protein ACFCUY_12410 [Xenococcaceae cyanobacterium]